MSTLYGRYWNDALGHRSCVQRPPSHDTRCHPFGRCEISIMGWRSSTPTVGSRIHRAETYVSGWPPRIDLLEGFWGRVRSGNPFDTSFFRSSERTESRRGGCFHLGPAPPALVPGSSGCGGPGVHLKRRSIASMTVRAAPSASSTRRRSTPPERPPSSTWHRRGMGQGSPTV